MKIEKDLLCVPLAVLSFFGSYLLLPYTETYQGMSGYIYDFGWICHLGHILLLVIGVILLNIPVVNRLNIEVR